MVALLAALGKADRVSACKILQRAFHDAPSRKAVDLSEKSTACTMERVSEVRGLSKTAKSMGIKAMNNQLAHPSSTGFHIVLQRCEYARYVAPILQNRLVPIMTAGGRETIEPLPLQRRTPTVDTANVECRGVALCFYHRVGLLHHHLSIHEHGSVFFKVKSALPSAYNSVRNRRSISVGLALHSSSVLRLLCSSILHRLLFRHLLPTLCPRLWLLVAFEYAPVVDEIEKGDWQYHLVCLDVVVCGFSGW